MQYFSGQGLNLLSESIYEKQEIRAPKTPDTIALKTIIFYSC